MSGLPRSAVAEFHKVWIKALDNWVEIPVWHEEDASNMVEQFDLEDLEIDDYKRKVAEFVGVHDRGVDEVYAKIIKFNPQFHPKNIFRIKVLSTTPQNPSEVERERVMRFFATRSKKSIQVIQGGLVEPENEKA